MAPKREADLRTMFAQQPRDFAHERNAAAHAGLHGVPDYASSTKGLATFVVHLEIQIIEGGAWEAPFECVQLVSRHLAELCESDDRKAKTFLLEHAQDTFHLMDVTKPICAAGD